MTTSPEGRPAQRERLSKGERTKQRIVELALETFATSGFNAVSLRDIATQAGMTHAGLLHHFDGKKDLLAQVLSYRDRRDRAQMPDRSAPVAERFAWLVSIVERNVAAPGGSSLYATLSGEAVRPDHPAHDHFVARFRYLQSYLADAFEDAFAEQADPPPIAPAQAARQLLALLDGLQLHALYEPDEHTMIPDVIASLNTLGITVRPRDVAHATSGDAPTTDGA
ncbi:TetR/AcrR family transcriptional regulator [Mycetocola reblochoni]|uniref:Transcriptional regulator, TetR family n=2 Tax=Mycetocola reblochoni TaxID=331618 RepID=A0A1R4J1L7_9MICO|nr:TetR/AcrR family transcriptional regulator [Mycetocola reblochoni]RLP71225.1 TetR/AcrR family transcriptional regulator [Mycetocola reblochoni]SJN25927.1 Transcriptional regulator, TetR family [Mycetocola reblochoni REB411]